MTSIILASLLWSMSQGDAIELRGRLERMLSLGRVMYVAAHPDDENTQLLAYLVHGRQLQTAYLSLTRGDGGQNLIGDEQSPLLGVIRSYELMAARRIDGAEQLFTRARDFGYSKRAEEALSIWGHEEVLGEVVFAIRRFRPQVIVTRFPEEGPTHGHHLASAILAREAFSAAADPKRFPEQLTSVSPWAAERVVFNVPTQFMPDEIRDDDLVVDIGGYHPARRQSFGEIAAESRSMHKSQGFGAARRWGPHPERFRHVDGTPAEKDPFAGLSTSYRSLPGGEKLARALEEARDGFRIEEPAATVPRLQAAWKAAEALEDEVVKASIRERIARLALDASGLLLEARAEETATIPGASLPVTIHATLRGRISGVALTELADEARSVALEPHERHEWKTSPTIASDAAVSSLPWLAEPPAEGRYRGPGASDEPLPPPAVVVRLGLDLAGIPLDIALPVERVWVDPVDGERRREVEILPPITVTPEGKALMLVGDESASLKLMVRVRGAGGTLRFEAPDGYRAEPAQHDVSEDGPVTVTLRATHPGAAPGSLRIVASAESFSGSFAEEMLKHAHLPLRTVLLPASVILARVDLEVPRTLVGHIAGPGDQVAASLRRVGFDVRDIDDATLESGVLDGYGAILVGIRAFNTNEALRRNVRRLHEYAESGGTVVVQYVTRHRSEPLGVELGPRDLTLGRGRVTDQGSAVAFLEPDHPVLQFPHRISAKDFEGWVQERGLYFAESWDEAYRPLLSLSDPGEDPEHGSLLVADIGKGRFIYTGLSFFRQLPAGVPGAYRLMANLLAPPAGASAAPPDEPPPLLGSWRNLYLLVGAVLVLLMIAFYLLSRRYRP